MKRGLIGAIGGLAIALGIIVVMVTHSQGQQQPTWWLVANLSASVAEGHSNTPGIWIIGPFPDALLCQSGLNQARRTLDWNSSGIRTINCRSNIDVARMLLQP